MLNIAICDDERTQITYLTELIRKWASMRGVAACFSDYESAESFLFAYEANGNIDILLLDIQMKKMNGIELAHRVRSGNSGIQLIFVTGYMEYMADGYDVDALHYLMKPVIEEKFYGVLDKAAKKIKQNERMLILDLTGEKAHEIVCIPMHEIKFLEVLRNYVTVHAKVDYTVKSSLIELEKKLDGTFFRAGRSFIVNLKFVNRVTKMDIFLSDESKIPLPRGFYDKINRAMIERL